MVIYYQDSRALFLNLWRGTVAFIPHAPNSEWDHHRAGLKIGITQGKGRDQNALDFQIFQLGHKSGADGAGITTTFSTILSMPMRTMWTTMNWSHLYRHQIFTI